jgi:outer membrane receptor for ferric coprogen and ferric-rhodotorulic acid
VFNWNGDISEVTYTRTGARRVAKTTQSGVYLATRLRLADPLSLIAGARLSRWETSAARTTPPAPTPAPAVRTR